ncbi:hypothetical protein D3C81_1645440 [compost metagenome]
MAIVGEVAVVHVRAHAMQLEVAGVQLRVDAVEGAHRCGDQLGERLQAALAQFVGVVGVHGGSPHAVGRHHDTVPGAGNTSRQNRPGMGG